MITQLQIHPYELIPNKHLGQKLKAKPLTGALLRFFDGKKGPLYLDAPDLPFGISAREFVQKLQTGLLEDRERFLIEQSLAEFKNRSSKKSLITQITTQKNHLLITDPLHFKIQDADVTQVTHIKVKAGKDLVKETNFLIEILALSPKIRIRLDFNLSLTFEAFMSWWKDLSVEVKNSLDFIEDPFEWNESNWELATLEGAPLANDFATDFGEVVKLKTPLKVLKAVIVKPYISFDEKLIKKLEGAGVRIVFTHAMESAVGRLYAASMAITRANKNEVHGLSVGDFYKNDFAIDANGKGLGLVDSLESLDWKQVEDVFVEDEFSGDASVVFANPKLIKQGELQKLPMERSRLWFATSGSTGSPKWIAIQKSAFLSAAESVNRFFGFTSSDVFFRSLPKFHVGGLAIIARARLLYAQVVTWKTGETWSPAEFIKIINENLVTVASLVPTQVYDLVNAKLSSPKSLRILFVGGGALSQDLYKKAKALGWPVIPSFGMTETSGMIAAANPENCTSDKFPELTILPHAEVKVDKQNVASVKATSLLEGYFDSKTNEFIEHEGWFQTSDRVVIKDGKIIDVTRVSDSVKVKGELVLLPEIENHLANALNVKVKVLSMPHARFENEIVVCFETKAWSQVAVKYEQSISELPRLLAPTKVVLVSDWPTNEMGKWSQVEFDKALHRI